MLRRSLIIDPQDNVAVILEDGKKGDIIQTPDGIITLLEDVEMAHKIAIFDLLEDSPVYKYGHIIGYMDYEIPKGTWVHSHNMRCDRGKKKDC